MQIHGTPCAFIIDNASIHAEAESVMNAQEFHGCRVVRLSRYSPQLNAIEMLWSQVKAHVRKKLAQEMPQILEQQGRTFQYSFCSLRVVLQADQKDKANRTTAYANWRNT